MRDGLQYEDVTLYFYSGSGNSYRAATWMAAAGDGGAAVRVRPIGSAQPAQEIGGGETALLGLVMSTHGFTAPWPMLRFALRLPRRRKTHAVVVATRAAFEGSACLLIALILLLKGYRVRGTLGVSMPSSWITVHPGFPPDRVAKIMPQARLQVSHFRDTISAGQRSFTSWPGSILGLLILPISLGYLLLGRFFLGKLFFASDDCTGCGLCAEHCPNQAIEMRGREGRCRPYWTFRCESCVRCMAYCPTQAIEASHLLGVGAYLLAAAIPTAALLVWLATIAPGLAFLSRIPRWVLQSVTPLIVIGAAYPFFHLLLRVGWLNRFFTLATLTHYYRRYHEPETTLEDLG
jgi:Pyruvate/2-oxoacid:ferredoxin oxidoreductase delta subunit